MPDERAQWGRPIEFILTLVGYAVGLGNVWRFPFLCYKNGGGAFLIPYVICLIFLGIPIFALEVSFGQYGGKGPISIWGINPLAKGIGFASLAVSAILLVYYSVVIAWALRFLIASFTSHLPWIDCDDCRCLLYNQNASDPAQTCQAVLLNTSISANCSIRDVCTIADGDYTSIDNNTNITFNDPVSPSELYFNEKVLWKSDSIEDTGSVQWELVLCNMACFVIVFLVLYKGIQSLGKVVYFTATFPYVLLTILLIRGCLLEGASEGIKYYLQPRWDRLADAEVWSDAATQIFFSLSCCSGGLIAMSSYNNFHNNILRDSLVVPIINCATSFYAGFVVFATLGYMAHVKQVSVDEVTTGGPGLAFVVYPEAIAQMPVSPLWAILFFVMLCILGFSSQFSTVETVITAFVDEFPHVLKSKSRVLVFRISIAVAGFLLGLPLLTQSGSYLLDLVDGALLGFPMLGVGLAELLVVCMFYGYKNLSDDIFCMIGRRPFIYLEWCWKVVTPVLLTAVIIFKAFQTSAQHPDWANLVYWLIVTFVLGCIPGWLIFTVCRHSQMTQPTEAWWNHRLKGKQDVDLDIDLKENGADKEISMSLDELPASTNKVVPSPSPGTSNGFINDAFNKDDDSLDTKMEKTAL